MLAELTPPLPLVDFNTPEFLALVESFRDLVAQGKKATADFETRSYADLRAVGAAKYAEHETTDAICMAFKIPGDAKPTLWFGRPCWNFGLKTKPPVRLFAWIMAGGLVEAHNAFFERSVWRYVMVRKYGWPDIPDAQFRCSMAKATGYGLPRGLDEATRVMETAHKKNARGKDLINLLCKPDKKLGWRGTVADFIEMGQYCADDVLAEESLSESLPELPGIEWDVWLLDQKINERGVLIDIKMAMSAVEMVEQLIQECEEELSRITNFKVERSTQRDRMIAWLNENGCDIKSLNKATVEETLKNGHNYLSEDVKRALEIRQITGQTSVSKYKTMLVRANEDERARGNLMFNGATTGRWSSTGIQLQNIKRGSIKDMDMECEIILSGDLDRVKEHVRTFTWKDSDGKQKIVYGNVMDFLTSAIRGAIRAPKGRNLIAADYSGVEARGTAWLAGQYDLIEVFMRGEDIYCYMASKIYGRPINKDDHPNERQLGKVAVLGLGYGMGAQKFYDTCIAQGIDITFEQAAEVVKIYRESNSAIKQFWWDCEAAARKAIRFRDRGTQCPWIAVGPGHIHYKCVGKWLLCRLPSGRCLVYPFPRLRKGEGRDVIEFMAVSGTTHQWTWEKTYGGKLVENIVQAVCRDLMAEAMLRIENHQDKDGVQPFDVILTVHDELVLEIDEDRNQHFRPVEKKNKKTGEIKIIQENIRVRQVEKLMSTLPKWATGFPLGAEGWSGDRYKK